MSGLPESGCSHKNGRDMSSTPEADNGVRRFEPLWGTWRIEAFLDCRGSRAAECSAPGQKADGRRNER